MRATLVRKKRLGILLRLIGAESYREGQSRLEELERVAAESRAPDQWIEVILALRDDDRIGDLTADYLVDRFAEGAVDRLRQHDLSLLDLGRQVDEYYQKEARDRAEAKRGEGPSHLDDDDVEWEETTTAEDDRDDRDDDDEERERPSWEAGDDAALYDEIERREREIKVEYFESIGEGARGSALATDPAGYYADVEAGLASLTRRWTSRQLRRTG